MRSHLVLVFSVVVSALLLFNAKIKQEPNSMDFERFKKEFNKNYPSKAQEHYRKAIFSENMDWIEEHNADQALRYKLGVTFFTDLTQEEFVQTYLGTHENSKSNLNQEMQVETGKNLKKVQNDIDWVQRGNVSPVRNQGMCGSCWAISTSGAVQSSYSIFHSDKTTLSVQQLVDCSNDYGNSGCNGGQLQGSFAYIKDHGLSTEKEYPYVGRPQSCKKNDGNYRISNFVATSDCGNLYNALSQRPISVVVDAATWALYKEGILTICGRNVNHGVLLVGATDSYWRIKNSWGVNWGQNGYIRIARGNTCAVCSSPYYPLL